MEAITKPRLAYHFQEERNYENLLVVEVLETSKASPCQAMEKAEEGFEEAFEAEPEDAEAEAADDAEGEAEAEVFEDTMEDADPEAAEAEAEAEETFEDAVDPDLDAEAEAVEAEALEIDHGVEELDELDAPEVPEEFVAQHGNYPDFVTCFLYQNVQFVVDHSLRCSLV